MDTTLTQEPVAKTSPRLMARTTGIVYLLYFLTAILGQLITNRGLVGVGDAVGLVAILLYIVVTLLFYSLFKSVSKGLALLAVFVSLAGCVDEILRLLHLLPLPINSLIFFGPFDILIGYLILRSTFLPRILGVLMVLAGLGWLVFLSLPRANALVICIEIFGFLTEVVLMFWLLVMGVNTQRWQEQAGAAGHQ